MAIIVVILMMLSGGGFGVMKWLELGPFEPLNEETSLEKLEKIKPTFIKVDPLIVNVFSGNKIISTLQIAITLEVRGEDNIDFINANMTKITDALFRDMHAFLPRIISPEDNSLNVFLLKKRLKLTTDRLFPEKQIYDVLIQSITTLG